MDEVVLVVAVLYLGLQVLDISMNLARWNISSLFLLCLTDALREEVL